MSIDAEVLSEMFVILKQYIPSKDRQEAADNLVGVLVDLLGDQELKDFCHSDKVLTKAYREYAVDDDDDYVDEDE